MEKDFYWLNAKSRTFLERGYLKLNQTAEERIKEIAAATRARIARPIASHARVSGSIRHPPALGFHLVIERLAGSPATAGPITKKQ